jgi:ABC-type transporter Mla subunit MlaD
MADITIRISDKELRIATLAVLGTVALWLFAYLYASGMFVRTYRVSIYAPESDGLSVGSPVLLDSTPVGVVDTVKLARTSATAQRRIELVLRIRKEYQNDIREDSVATAVTQGFLGNRVISIQRGFSGATIRPGDEIHFAETPKVDFASLLTKIADCERQLPRGASR